MFLSDHIGPSLMLTIVSRMINNFLAHSLIFQHIPFWCPFLDLHPTMHQSKVGVYLKENNKFGTSTLI